MATKVMPTMWERARVIRLLQRMNGLEHMRIHPELFESARGKRGKVAWLRRTFREFAANTVLHGYNHIVQAHVTKYERIFWLFVVVSALIIAIALLCVSWLWGAETPTITLIESTHHPIPNVHFPAITICNMNKISAKRAAELAQRMVRSDGIAAAELAQLFALMLHFQGVGSATADDYTRLHQALQENHMSVLDLAKALAPDCNEMLQRCRWNGNDVRCDTLYQPVDTTEGSCCAFNYYGRYATNFPVKTALSMPKKPRRTSSCGFQTGLTTILTPLSEDYHSSIYSSYGFRVFVHDPYDYADDNADIKAVARKSVAFITVYPETTHSTDSVRKLAPAVRDCYYSDEYRLVHHKRYSYTNCMAECRSTVANELCGCVPYFMLNNGSYRLCEMTDMACIRRHRAVYFSAMPGLNGTVFASDRAAAEFRPCNCLADCELNDYSAESSVAPLDRTFSTGHLSLFNEINVTDHSSINVFFADLESIHYRRDVYQNWLNLLAAFGGILGLLLGFSFVSGFEVIYFFVIRPLIDYAKRNGH